MTNEDKEDVLAQLKALFDEGSRREFFALLDTLPIDGSKEVSDLLKSLSAYTEAGSRDSDLRMDELDQKYRNALAKAKARISS